MVQLLLHNCKCASSPVLNCLACLTCPTSQRCPPWNRGCCAPFNRNFSRNRSICRFPVPNLQICFVSTLECSNLSNLSNWSKISTFESVSSSNLPAVNSIGKVLSVQFQVQNQNTLCSSLLKHITCLTCLTCHRCPHQSRWSSAFCCCNVYRSRSLGPIPRPKLQMCFCFHHSWTV